MVKKYSTSIQVQSLRNKRNKLIKFYDEFNNQLYLDKLVGYFENRNQVKISNRRLNFTLLDGCNVNIRFLIGTSHLGLLMYDNGTLYQLLSDKGFYGITRYKNDWFAFHKTGMHGRVISFTPSGNHISKVKSKIYGLSRGIHQIDFIRDKLFITDTYNNAILRYDHIIERKRPLYWREYEAIYHPNEKLVRGRLSENYSHFNSIYAYDDKIYLVAHNETYKTGRLSEIYTLDQKFQKMNIRRINGSNCHNYYKDKKLEIICLSLEGKIQSNDRTVLDMKQFTRGTSISDDYYIFGGSEIQLNSEKRRGTDSVVFITTKEFEIILKMLIRNTQIQEIRRLDGKEYTLSNVQK